MLQQFKRIWLTGLSTSISSYKTSATSTIMYDGRQNTQEFIKAVVRFWPCSWSKLITSERRNSNSSSFDWNKKLNLLSSNVHDITIHLWTLSYMIYANISRPYRPVFITKKVKYYNIRLLVYVHHPTATKSNFKCSTVLHGLLALF